MRQESESETDSIILKLSHLTSIVRLSPHIFSLSLSTMSSPPPSPLFARSSSGSSNGAYMPLRISNVANILVKMRRHRGKAKEHHIESSSGDKPLTHPSLAGENAVSAQKVPLEESQTFVCRDGVDVAKLLRAVRGVLYQKALDVGANVLVDERYVSPFFHVLWPSPPSYLCPGC